MSKFKIGDTVQVASPAYVVLEDDAQGYVSPHMYGVVAEITKVYGEDDADKVGASYEVRAAGGLVQTVSQRYLTLAPTVVATSTLPDGVYREVQPWDDDAAGDIVIVRDGAVIEVLETNDGCPADGHMAYWKDQTGELLQILKRLMPGPTPEPEAPANGVYTDGYGELVHIKDGKARDLTDGDGKPYFGSTGYYKPETTTFTPYVVEDTTK